MFTATDAQGGLHQEVTCRRSPRSIGTPTLPGTEYWGWGALPPPPTEGIFLRVGEFPIDIILMEELHGRCEGGVLLM